MAIGLFLGLAPAGLRAAESPVVGIAAPLSGAQAILGEQIGTGALAAATLSAVATEIIDEGCTAAGGTAAGRQFAERGVSVVVGFLCADAIEAALPALAEAGIAVITPGVRADGLTDRRRRNGWPVYRTGPRADQERIAVSEILVRQWADVLFAIVDDGTIYGRELAESFRLAAEQAGLKPVFVDTYRPQLDNQLALAGRLRRAGATHVFVGGDRYDAAVLGRDAATLGYELTIAGGEALLAAPDEPDLAPGTLMIGLPDWRHAADPSVVESLAAAEIEADGYVLPAYAAMQVAIAAARLSLESGRSLVAVLDAERFETAIGPVRFDEKGDRIGNPYRLLRYDGTAFVEVEP
jgi:branched-chain amino acid transport system substrate-binding protein